ncbi:acyl carrier protein [Paenibacillus sp. CGMCC 1.16610]|uniref:Acyl carrier protein n=1 Tax=Paenibacillus anseongense TaxID=2682845 RepID=A0ABW9UC96_9BACL|nr:MULTISPECIES: phosphopantetheine-binding protein [Paenibacillus]MBA2943883.1 acyl carrier protein [Paenibacillus sp. CGMCC 1.16610]MVQ37772.1 acyl carrier protein [Paenibacillus anseongense]
MDKKTQVYDKAEIAKLIKQKIIIENLELKGVSPEDIVDHAPLFGEGLCLESVEAFYIAGGIEQQFGVPIDRTKLHQLRHHFQSVDTLTTYVYDLMASSNS